jgi:RNA polymerase sigma-70 factor (ECF subfamily)
MDEARDRFMRLVMPHLGAAYNLARWLLRDARDAEDVVQDAMVRALRHIGTLRGADARPWLLAIVRHASYAFLRTRRPAEWIDLAELDASDAAALADPGPHADPQAAVIRQAERALLNEAIAALPVPYREVLILREFEDLSYREIARIGDVPIGTVMSRLSRARRLLAQSLGAIVQAGAPKREAQE